MNTIKKLVLFGVSILTLTSQVAQADATPTLNCEISGEERLSVVVHRGDLAQSVYDVTVFYDGQLVARANSNYTSVINNNELLVLSSDKKVRIVALRLEELDGGRAWQGRMTFDNVKKTNGSLLKRDSVRTVCYENPSDEE